MSNAVRCSSSKIRTLIITNLDAQITPNSWKFLSTPGRLVYCPVTIDATTGTGPAYDYVEDIVASPKSTGQTWTPPQLVYYDYGNAVFTTTGGITSSVKAGEALEAAGTAATSGRIRFNQPL